MNCDVLYEGQVTADSASAGASEGTVCPYHWNAWRFHQPCPRITIWSGAPGKACRRLGFRQASQLWFAISRHQTYHILWLVNVHRIWFCQLRWPVHVIRVSVLWHLDENLIHLPNAERIVYTCVSVYPQSYWNCYEQSLVKFLNSHLGSENDCLYWGSKFNDLLFCRSNEHIFMKFFGGGKEWSKDQPLGFGWQSNSGSGCVVLEDWSSL